MDDQAINATVDGLFLNQWCQQNKISRSIGFGLLRIVQGQGIEVSRARQQGSSKPSAFLSGQALQAMDSLLAEFKNGASLPTLEARYSSAIVPAVADSEPAAIVASNDPAPEFSSAELIKRLEAAKLAIETGLPLRATEAQWILGGSCTSAHVRKAHLQVVRHAVGSYTICGPLVD